MGEEQTGREGRAVEDRKGRGIGRGDVRGEGGGGVETKGYREEGEGRRGQEESVWEREREP